MSQKPEGAGSIWNVNSWHWEMKNYTETSKKIISSKIQNLIIKDQNITIKSIKPPLINGQAQISIRKGKQILIYDFNAEIYFRSQNNEGQVQGTYKVKQINSDNPNDLQISDIKFNEKHHLNDKIKDILRKKAKNIYLNEFKDFKQTIAKFQSDPQKLQQDKLKRQQAQKITQKVTKQKGAQKQRLLQQQKKKQHKMKQQFSKWNK